MGVWARGASKNSGPPETIGTSNFKFGTQLGFGSSSRRNNFYDQNWRGSIQKNLGPLLIFAATKAGNFKFGAQLWSGE